VQAKIDIQLIVSSNTTGHTVLLMTLSTEQGQLGEIRNLRDDFVIDYFPN